MARQADLRIEKQYVEKALNQIERDRNVPANRRSHDYCLKIGEKHYPPKYVLSQAHYYKTGKARKGFKGGPQTNTLLQELEYTVEPCTDPDCQEWLIQ
jgi:hypothetical protein